MILGTPYFPTLGAAESYYGRQAITNPQRYVTEALRDGSIHIGKPPVRTGQRVVTVDGGLRYAIYTEGE